MRVKSNVIQIYFVENAQVPNHIHYLLDRYIIIYLTDKGCCLELVRFHRLYLVSISPTIHGFILVTAIHC